MSLNREMLQVARLAPRLLGESTELVGNFLQSLVHPDGGFQDRTGQTDLYYTAFGIGGLLGLQLPLPEANLRPYLKSFGDGESLDLVHLACLLRCWSALPLEASEDRPVDGILARIDEYRSEDGGYGSVPHAKTGTVYACFLGLGAYQDAGQKVPAPGGLLNCIESLRCPDGGYANSSDMPVGLTPPSAAAAALLRHLDAKPDPTLRDWLLSRLHRSGGFCVTPDVPMPDLLSTGTALHALVDLKTDIEPFKELCLDYIDTLWNARGGFHGNWDDDDLDCEYTYYGLLSLGHLSL